MSNTPPKRKPLFSIGSVHFVGAYGEYLILQGNLMKSEDRFSISWGLCNEISHWSIALYLMGCETWFHWYVKAVTWKYGPRNSWIRMPKSKKLWQRKTSNYPSKSYFPREDPKKQMTFQMTYQEVDHMSLSCPCVRLVCLKKYCWTPTIWCEH